MTGTASNTMAIRGLFFWGLALTWIPFAVIVVPAFINIFGGITNQKATGLGAVAGGLSGAFMAFGIIAFAAAQILAIFFLVRCIGPGGTGQHIFAILSIGLSVVTLVATGLGVWLILFVVPRLHNR